MLNDSQPPFSKALNVAVGDTAYSAVTFLYQAAEHADPVEVVRVRGNRVFTDSRSLTTVLPEKAVLYGSESDRHQVILKLTEHRTRPFR
ncbi:hypothetical protein QUF90_17710 [Desulfococcaceae bacterium HSG9]|nr:hypothetical protein [Desulfococcaceae bacterium HSG9]